MTEVSGEHPRAELRASDADREQAADRLRKICAEGRVTLEELSELLSRTYAARTYGELDAVLGSLPVPVSQPPPGAPAEWRPPRPPRSPRPAEHNVWWRAGLRPYVVINSMLIVIWAITGAGYFWPIWPLLGWGAALALFAVGGHKPRGHGHGPPWRSGS